LSVFALWLAGGTEAEAAMSGGYVPIPTKTAADQHVRIVAVDSRLVSVSSTPCRVHGTAGPDTGFWEYI
jgi:hypothetical protein